jgi:hypothetical protein
MARESGRPFDTSPTILRRALYRVSGGSRPASEGLLGRKRGPAIGLATATTAAARTVGSLVRRATRRREGPSGETGVAVQGERPRKEGSGGGAHNTCGAVAGHHQARDALELRPAGGMMQRTGSCCRCDRGRRGRPFGGEASCLGVTETRGVAALRNRSRRPGDPCGRGQSSWSSPWSSWSSSSSCCGSRIRTTSPVPGSVPWLET